jgi:PTH1 family peptidyl-tRNA hydrolase
MVVEAIIDQLNSEKKAGWRFNNSLVKKIIYKKQRLILARPQTFMNLSGQAVAGLLQRFKIPLAKLVVIHDDLDLEFGRLKIKLSGGTAGHNGVESIVEKLGSENFLRVRLGIGRGKKGGEKDYVLENFSPEQKSGLPEFLNRAAGAVLTTVTRGPQVAMNLYNR